MNIIYHSETNFAVQKITYSYMCHKCSEEFLDSNFDYTVIDKISIVTEIAPNFTYSQNLIF